MRVCECLLPELRDAVVAAPASSRTTPLLLFHTHTPFAWSTQTHVALSHTLFIQGVELMFLLLKAKRASRYGAIKALDFACTR